MPEKEKSLTSVNALVDIINGCKNDLKENPKDKNAKKRLFLAIDDLLSKIEISDSNVAIFAELTQRGVNPLFVSKIKELIGKVNESFAEFKGAINSVKGN